MAALGTKTTWTESQLFATVPTRRLTERWDFSISLRPLSAWGEAERATAPPGADAEIEA